MNRISRLISLAPLAVALVAAPLAGQAGGKKPESATPAQLRDMIIEDSLTPAKMQLRDFVAELRDSLYFVSAVHSSVSRNLATGTSSVVLSDGRLLGRRCRMGAAMADLTSQRVATMYTNDPRGDQALNTYRAGLAALVDDMKSCMHDDSLTMAITAPDQKKIEQLSSSASDAVTRYDTIRDGLMKLLNITLPVKGRINARH